MSRHRLTPSRNPANLRPLTQAIEALEPRKLFANTLGIDISSAVSNWSTLKNTDNIQFMYVQSSYGGAAGQEQTYWAKDVTGARAAGIAAGAYHFAYPASSTALAEADYFYSIASSAMKPGYLPPMLDIEETGDDGSSSASAWVNTFCTELKAKSGVTPIVYTYSSFASSYLNSTVTQWPLWIANYDGSTASEAVPSGPWSTTAWKIHQYEGTTTLSGDSVDGDAFKGDTTALAAFEIQSTSPAISVQQGSTTLANNGSVSFGTANLIADDSLTFTVTNSGGGTLTLGSVTTTGAFTVTSQPSTSVSGGTQTTFTVKMTTTSTGSESGVVSFTNNISGQSPFKINVSGTVVDPTPAAPSNIQFTAYSNNSVTLHWTDNSNGKATFNIERKTGASGIYSQIFSTTAGATSFVDSATLDPSNVLAPGTIYYYRLRAVNGAYFSDYATEQWITTLANAPTNIAATNGTLTDRVRITWSAATGAYEYQVYRATTNNGTQVALGAPTTATTADDMTPTPGMPFYYWVAALNSALAASPHAGPAGGFIPPAVVSGSFNDVSQPATVSFTFNEAMQTMTTSNLSVTNTDGNAAPTVIGYSYSSATKTATFSLSSGLVDGHYQATLTGAQDLNNTQLVGANSLKFSFLTGDADGDGTVDSGDFAAIAANYGMTGDPTFNQGDFNYDGTVNALDFNALATRFGQSELPAGSSLAVASAPAEDSTAEGSTVAESLPASSSTPAASLFSNQPVSGGVIDLTQMSDNSVLT